MTPYDIPTTDAVEEALARLDALEDEPDEEEEA